MSLVKTINYKQATVNIHDDYIPKNLEMYKQNLKKVYETINVIVQKNNSLDVNKLFYKPNELMLLKENILI